MIISSSTVDEGFDFDIIRNMSVVVAVAEVDLNAPDICIRKGLEVAGPGQEVGVYFEPLPLLVDGYTVITSSTNDCSTKKPEALLPISTSHNEA
jgi:hypothetical protein